MIDIISKILIEIHFYANYFVYKYKIEMFFLSF